MALIKSCLASGTQIYSKLNQSGTTVDISDHPNYANLTADDIKIVYKKMSAGGATATQHPNVTLGVTAYDSSTGVATICTGFNDAGQYAVTLTPYDVYIF